MDFKDCNFDPEKVDTLILIDRTNINQYEPISAVMNELLIKNPAINVLFLINNVSRMFMLGGLKRIMQNFHLNEFTLWPSNRKEVKDFIDSSREKRNIEVMDLDIGMGDTQKEHCELLVSMIRQILKHLTQKYKKVKK